MLYIVISRESAVCYKFDILVISMSGVKIFISLSTRRGFDIFGKCNMKSWNGKDKEIVLLLGAKVKEWLYNNTIKAMSSWKGTIIVHRGCPWEWHVPNYFYHFNKTKLSSLIWFAFCSLSYVEYNIWVLPFALDVWLKFSQ